MQMTLIFTDPFPQWSAVPRGAFGSCRDAIKAVNQTSGEIRTSEPGPPEKTPNHPGMSNSRYLILRHFYKANNWIVKTVPEGVMSSVSGQNIPVINGSEAASTSQRSVCSQ